MKPAILSADHLAMRTACFQDMIRLIKNCIEDTPSQDGKEALRFLGAAISDSGVEGFGIEGTAAPISKHLAVLATAARGDERQAAFCKIRDVISHMHGRVTRERVLAAIHNIAISDEGWKVQCPACLYTPCRCSEIRAEED